MIRSQFIYIGSLSWFNFIPEREFVQQLVGPGLQHLGPVLPHVLVPILLGQLSVGLLKR